MDSNDRTAWILVAFMVLTFIGFAAGIIALAFGPQFGWFLAS